MKGFIFDLDGTIYLDEEKIEGAPEILAKLKARGDKIIFLTNKSIASREDYLKKLNNMGIDVKLDEIINSNYITAKYLKSVIQKEERVYVIGECPLIEELELENITITENPLAASYVVLGWDRKFNYKKLNDAFQAWKNGAQIIATNPDRTCPIKGGEIPDCGAMIGALEGATGETVKMIAGKPSAMVAEHILKDILNMSASHCYMVGDRLETDILMANQVGMNSVLVMTGVTTKSMLKKTDYQPKYVLESVKGILDL